MAEPIIEDVPSRLRWRWRVVRGWTMAVSTVVGAGAGLIAFGINASAAYSQPAFFAGLGAAVAGVYAGRRGWQRWRGAVSPPPLEWRPQLPTPQGTQPGLLVRRPPPLGKGDRLTASAMGFAAAVPLSSAAGEDWLLANSLSVVAVASAVVLTRRLARLVIYPSAVAITSPGLLTQHGLVSWEAIGEVTVREAANDRVRVAVTGRRRPLVMDRSDMAMPASELARMIEHYRDAPQQRAALGRPPTVPGQLASGTDRWPISPGWPLTRVDGR